jgi:hypothetical protein
MKNVGGGTSERTNFWMVTIKTKISSGVALRFKMLLSEIVT